MKRADAPADSNRLCRCKSRGLGAVRCVFLPVEVKSSRAPAQPRPSHILQLAAYCLLVEECYGRCPPYGIIKYADRTFEVDYTPELEDELLATLDDMRNDLDHDDAPRNHDDPVRCQFCGYSQHCEQKI